MVEIKARPYELEAVESSRYNAETDNQRTAVFSIIDEYKFPVCDRKISEELDLPLNLITARRNELVDAKLVEFAYKAKSPYTGIKVKHWKVRGAK